jgi:hypothetical protein
MWEPGSGWKVLIQTADTRRSALRVWVERERGTPAQAEAGRAGPNPSWNTIAQRIYGWGHLFSFHRSNEGLLLYISYLRKTRRIYPVRTEFYWPLDLSVRWYWGQLRERGFKMQHAVIHNAWENIPYFSNLLLNIAAVHDYSLSQTSVLGLVFIFKKLWLQWNSNPMDR